jgi:hypothetical protein
VIRVEDDGGSLIQCNEPSDKVSVAIVPGTGAAGALLSGDNPLPTTGGIADWSTATNPLFIDLPGLRYRLEFTHPLAVRTRSRTFSLDPGLSITGPASYCASGGGLFSTDPGFDTYRWYVDAAGPLSRGLDLTLGAGSLTAGPHSTQVDATVDTCPATTSQPFDVLADLSSVSIDQPGPYTVCSTCTGPALTVTDTDGGVPTHQWGYRTVSYGAVTDIPGRTGTSYDINGSDFPGVGTYYVVETTTPACGSALVSSNEIQVTVTDPTGTPADDVVFFTITSRDSENVLEWVNPPGYDTVRIHYTTGSGCTFPTDPLAAGTLLADRTDPDGTGGRDSFPHGGLSNGTTYCYTLFVDKGAGTYSGGRSNRGRPMDTTGPVKWAFSTGVFTLTAPTVGTSGIVAFSNDYVLHAMERGLSGGQWPTQWLPVSLGAPVPSRSPIIPIAVGSVDPVIYLADTDGVVSAPDGAKGDAGPAAWSPASLGGLKGWAAPAGMFGAYGGGFNYLLVGTRESGADNRFYAIDPSSGAEIGYFDNGGGGAGIGIINAMASIDYTNSRVFFTSYSRSGGSQGTLWCLQLQAPSPSPFSLAWAPRELGDIDSSPVLRGGRVYVGSPLSSGTLYSVDAAGGLAVNDRTFVHSNDQVKGFVFPDRTSNDLYFATDDYVWAVTDTGSPSMTNRFGPGGITLAAGVVPTSPVLYLSDSQKVYVGASDGRLYEIDVSGASPSIESVQLGDGSAAVGAPSYDRDNDLIHVGTEAGVFYAVDVPLLP